MNTSIKEKTKTDIDLLVDDYIEKKMNENYRFIECSFYDLKVRLDLLEDEVQEFLKIAKNDLEADGYEVYFTGAKYKYNGKENIVETNNLMIAIKR